MNQISLLPKAQQENVRACLNAARRKSGCGNRYTTDWIYHCMLLKIRSNAAYEYLRNNNILALPAQNTIRRYLRKLKPAYGFNTAIFEAMLLKSESMMAEDRRGIKTLILMHFFYCLRFKRW